MGRAPVDESNFPVLSTESGHFRSGILSLARTARSPCGISDRSRGACSRTGTGSESERIEIRLVTSAALLLTLTISATAACAQGPTQGPADPPAVAATAARNTGAPEPQWGPAPTIFPAGAQMAVMQGDPSGTALFTVRLRLPNGYRIPPHTHPTDEHVTVISGSFRVGMGTSFDEKGMMTLGPGGFVTAPANHAHYAAAHGMTVVQVHAMGPFAMTYVNPADTPEAARSR